MLALTPVVDNLLDSIGDIPAWMRDALCPEHPETAAAFFPERGHSTRPARALCRRCLVRAECLGYALDHGLDEGIWGGSSPAERALLAKRGVTGDLVRRFGSDVDAGRELLIDEAAFG